MGEVISLGEKRKEAEGQPKVEMSETDLELIQKKNAANAERLKKERAKSNKGVIRSYRLKH